MEIMDKTVIKDNRPQV